MQRLLARLEGARSLDRAADSLRRLAGATVGRGRLRSALHGTWFGHPLHPAIVQFPVGAWMSTAVLDLIPGTERAAAALLTAGTAGALPAATTGLADYTTLSRRQRRVALVHVGANTAALGCFAASIAARMRGDHRRGRMLSFAGLGVAGIGAYLGGHLAFSQAAGVDPAAAVRESGASAREEDAFAGGDDVSTPEDAVARQDAAARETLEQALHNAPR